MLAVSRAPDEAWSSFVEFLGDERCWSWQRLCVIRRSWLETYAGKSWHTIPREVSKALMHLPHKVVNGSAAIKLEAIMKTAQRMLAFWFQTRSTNHSMPLLHPSRQCETMSQNTVPDSVRPRGSSRGPSCSTKCTPLHEFRVSLQFVRRLSRYHCVVHEIK